MRSEGLRRPCVRALISLGLPSIAAAGWVAMLWSRLGPATREVLWSHAIVRRVRGFDGLHHHNYLNRIAEQLDLDAAPWAWTLGLFGLILFVAERQRARELAADAWLLFGVFVCSWLAFDVGSRAILPWYAFTLLMPLAFGNAVLITRACAAVFAPVPAPSGILTASGAAALVMIATDATRTYLPAPLTAAVLSGFLVLCAYAVTPNALFQRCAIALGVACVLALAGLLLRERYAYSESDPASVLGGELAKLGVKRISVDARAGFHDYTRVTFFGVKANMDGAPWTASRKSKKPPEARVEGEVLPREAQGMPGQRLFRAAGMFAVQGPLTQHPFDLEQTEAALNRGVLTYEAEDLSSGRYDTLEHRGSASAGALRSMSGWPRKRPEGFKLAFGTLAELPRGTYTARFVIHADCELLKGARLGEVTVANGGSPLASKPVQCAEKTGGDEPLSLQFTLLQPSRINVALRYDQGTIELDKLTLERKP
jgi:nitrate reductase gamma subunit